MLKRSNIKKLDKYTIDKILSYYWYDYHTFVLKMLDRRFEHRFQRNHYHQLSDFYEETYNGIIYKPPSHILIHIGAMNEKTLQKNLLKDFHSIIKKCKKSKFPMITYEEYSKFPITLL